MLLAAVVGTAVVAALADKIPAVVALLLGVGAVLALIERRRGEIPTVIRAQKIEIVGTDGMTRVALGETLDGEGAVATYDASGHFVAALEANARRSSPARSGASGGARTTYSAARAGVVSAAAAARASQG